MENQSEFKKQIELAVNKVNSNLGMICRSFEHLDGGTLLHLHNSIVRRNLEYCNSTWSTIYNKDIQLLEGVQRQVTKLVPELTDMEYMDRRKSLKLRSLVYRRLRGDLIEAFKFKNQIDGVNTETLLPFDTQSQTRRNS